MKTLAKLIFIFISGIISCALLTTSAVAQERDNSETRSSPNASVSQTIGTTQVTITYGRPGIKGRNIFGDLVPFDEVWRTGANESTAITFSENVVIEGQEVEAGTYSLYTIPSENEWTIILNSKLSWGTQYDENQDVVRVKTKQEKGEKVEQFMIYFEDVTDTSAKAVLHWDTTKVPFTIEV